jgi:cytochrome c-type biogenesis protein CcmH/NrfF
VRTPPRLLPGERWTVSVPVRDVTPAVRLHASVAVTPVLVDASGSTTALAPVEASTDGWAVPWLLLLLVVVVIVAVVTAVVVGRRRRRSRRADEEARIQQAVAEALRERETATP